MIVKTDGRYNKNFSLNSVSKFQRKAARVKIKQSGLMLRWNDHFKIDIYLIVRYEINALCDFRISTVDSVKLYLVFFEKLEAINRKCFRILGVQNDLEILDKFLKALHCFIPKN